MKNSIFLIINSLNGGGAEHVAARLSKEWSKEYNLFVISLMPFTSDDYDFYGETISVFDYYRGNNWMSKIRNVAKQIDVLANKYKPYAMISFLQNANLSLMFTKYNTKKIVSIRNYLGYQYKGIRLHIWNWLIKHYFKKADYVVSVSNKINNLMIKQYDISEEKSVCIYNPYEIEDILSKGVEELSEREKAFFGSHKVLCNVGHISQQKGQFHLIRILNELRKSDDSYGLIIVGKDESDFSKKIKHLVKKYHLNEHVLFVGLQNNPYKYMVNSFCFVFPSLYEGFPNAIVEAMICGLPIISFDCESGPREILKPLENTEYGCLIPVDGEKWLDINDALTYSEKLMIDHIEKLKHDSIFYNEQSTLVKQRANDFSTFKIITEWEKIINS